MADNIERPLVSVIVPVYNVEKYIRRCLDSIVAQTYENLEIILVNDGSTDDSGKICDEYAMKDERIKAVHQENGGLSAARNSGLDIMQGEWISFIDSDDFVCTHFIQRMLEAALDYQADIVHCRWETGNAEKIETPMENSIHIYSGIECYLNYFTMQKLPALESANNKLYRAGLFDGMRFIRGRYLEDLALMHQLFRQAEKVAYLNEKLYYYYKSSGSIIRGKFTINKLNALQSYEERLVFFYEIGGKELWGRALQQYEATLFKYYFWTKRDCKDHPEVIKELHDKIKDTYLQLKEQNSVSAKVKLAAWLGTKMPYPVGFMCYKLVDIRFWRK